MITKIYLNFPLFRVPLNALVRFNGVFYRRGYADRITREIQLVLAEGSAFSEITFVPRNSVVQYYVEHRYV